MKEFNQVYQKNSKNLALYVPVVARVHGGSHPEFHQVREVYDRIVSKVKDAGEASVELAEEFRRLREITNNYSVPADVCESYEAVYKMLEAIDNAYPND